ncbi:MAG: hypothetical protein SH859_17225 [Hyphomicrobium aestuarii]|nr:hypothetical protein [Hyphomicrobium aestuarii]
MNTHTSIGARALAIAAGVILLGGTLAILFEDVVTKSTPFGLKHWLTLVVLFGTLLTGHLVASAWSRWHWLSAIGFTLVFLVGTALVVYSSVGRQAETTIQTTAQIEEAAGRRVGMHKARNASIAMLAEAQQQLQSKCVMGNASKGTCDGIRATIAVYQAAVRGHDADLAALGPVKVATPEAEQLAEIAAQFGADKAKVKAGAVLVVPFLLTLFLEFGTIVCLGYGFCHTQRPAAIVNHTTVTQAKTLLGAPDSAPVDPRGGIAVATKAEALDDLRSLLKRGTPIDSQDILVERWGVSKGCVSKWLADWEADRHVIRQQSGKHKQVAAA